MSWRGSTMWWRGAPLCAVLLAAAFTVSCSSSQSNPTPPVLGDRRALPPVRVVPLDAGALSTAQPATLPPPAFPRTIALSALADGDRIADLAVLATSDRYLLAWVTYFDSGAGALRAAPAPKKGARATKSDKSQDKQGAAVMARALDAEGESIGGANVISLKGESIGGVSLAPSVAAGEAALAWVGRDAGIGQVFITRVSRSGEKQQQRMVTHSKEGCSDVALVPYKDGFVVAYVDLRDGDPGIYLTKVGKDLQRIGAERLVARAKGEASEVRMIVRGDEVVIAWAEARRNPDVYGIFIARHGTGDLAPRSDPARIVLAPQHTKGIELTSFGDGALLAWIEESAPAATGQSSPKTAVLTRLDSWLRAAEPARMALAVQASSVALDCDATCRVVVAGAEKDEFAFYGFRFDGAAAEPAARLASIPGVSTEDANPVVARDWLFFAEDNLHGAGRIRKAKLAWR